MRIRVAPEVLNEAAKIAALKVNPSEFAIKDNAAPFETPRVSQHWGEIRNEIIHAALQFLNSLSRDEAANFFKPGGGLNLARLAQAIHDHRHRWPNLPEERHGASLDNMTKTLRDAVSKERKKTSE